MSAGFAELEILQALYNGQPGIAKELIDEMSYGERRLMLGVMNQAANLLQASGVS